VELALHQVDENGFVNLSGIATPGGHYTVARNDTSGVIRLVPVKVTTTAVKRDEPHITDPNSLDTDTPWIGDDPS
jgi:hypothetical protein